MQGLDGLLHVGGRGRHQGRQAHQGDLLRPNGLHNGLRRHVLAQVQHPEAVALQQDLHDVLADVVNVPLHRGQHDLGGTVALRGGQILLQDLEGLLRRLGAHEQLGQEELALLKGLAHLVQGGDQLAVDDVENFSPALGQFFRLGRRRFFEALADGVI